MLVCAWGGVGCSDMEDGPNPVAPAVYSLSADVDIKVDGMGISHIYAKTDADAFYGAGYAMARDRLFQMEMSRRQALGSKAELLGEPALKGDIAARTMNFARLGKADAERLRKERPDDAALVDAWVAGVNKRIAEIASGKAPRPYGLRPTELDRVPEPWAPEHTFAIGKVLAFGLSNSLDAEVLATALMRLVPGINEHLPVMMPAYDTFILPSEGAPGSPSPVPAPPKAGGAGAPFEAPSAMIAPFHYVPVAPELGSNNWAVDGAHSENGRPLLAGDPHQGLTSPTRFWPLHMSSVEAGGTLDVVGFSFVGTPGVQLGHNAHVGWTATTNFGDAMDLWDVDPGDFTSVALGGEEHPIVTRTETIHVRDAEDVVLDIHDVPGYGVILPQEFLPVPLAVLADGQLLFNWTGFRPTMESAAYMAMDRAENLDEFEQATGLLDVGAVNLVAASADGISYHVHAAIPDRGDPASHPMPWRVLPGSDAETLWTRGDLPSSRLPRDRDPARGFLCSANNDPFGFTADGDVENDPFYYGAFYANGFRARRIEEALEKLLGSGKASRADMEDLQRDVKSLMADSLLPKLAEAMAAIETDPELVAYKGRKDLEDLAARLAAWDRRMSREQAAPVIWQGLQWFAAKRAFAGATSTLLFNAIATKSPPALLGMLRNLVVGRLKDASLFAPKGVNELLVGALSDTSAWLVERFGALDAPFTMSDYHGAEFATDFGGELTVPKVPVDGGSDTVNVSSSAFFNDDGTVRKDSASHEMALYRMVVGFGDDGVPEATVNFARGTRGDPDDTHFADQEEAWSKAEHAPLAFRRADVDAASTESLTLEAR